MSHTVQPKQILKKEVSTKEYNLLQEWAPQALQGYHHSESSSAASTQPEKMPNTVHDPIHRRPKNRSSSMYEEWKAQATRNEMTKEATMPAVKGIEGRPSAENISPASDTAVVSNDKPGRPKVQSSLDEEWRVQATCNETPNEAIASAAKAKEHHQATEDVSPAPDGSVIVVSDNDGKSPGTMSNGMVAPALHGHRRPLGQNAQSKATSSKFDFYLIAIPPMPP